MGFLIKVKFLIMDQTVKWLEPYSFVRTIAFLCFPALNLSREVKMYTMYTDQAQRGRIVDYFFVVTKLLGGKS